MAQLNSLMGFEHLDLKPVALTDADGKTHEFHFRAYLFGPGVALDAFEIRGGHPGGYQFQIIGDPEEDLLILLGRLIEKIRRDRIVCGKIAWDEAQDGSVPLLNIDGREIT